MNDTESLDEPFLCQRLYDGRETATLLIKGDNIPFIRNEISRNIQLFTVDLSSSRMSVLKLITRAVYSARLARGFIGLQCFDMLSFNYNGVMFGIDPTDELHTEVSDMTVTDCPRKDILVAADPTKVLDTVILRYEDGKRISVTYRPIVKVSGNRETCMFEMEITNDRRFDNNGFVLSRNMPTGEYLPRLFVSRGKNFIDNMYRILQEQESIIP